MDGALVLVQSAQDPLMANLPEAIDDVDPKGEETPNKENDVPKE